MRAIQTIELPGHASPGGFDHAAVHRASGRAYGAHTANNAVDVIDCATDRYLHSISNLTGVAGALVSDERSLLFTSNRGEDTVSILRIPDEQEVARIKVGVRPNGLAFDPGRGLLLAANVGNPEIANSFTISVVDVTRREMVHSIPVAGRTRWTVFDAASGSFYVNIADPYEIAVIDSDSPTQVSRSIPVPAKGPHGLDLDTSNNRLFCACDEGKLLAMDAATGKVMREAELSGTPDVIFFNAALKHLYVAVGEPGVIEVFETDALLRVEVVATGKGAHTLAFDAARNKLVAFLPQTHSAAVYVDNS